MSGFVPPRDKITTALPMFSRGGKLYNGPVAFLAQNTTWRLRQAIVLFSALLQLFMAAMTVIKTAILVASRVSQNTAPSTPAPNTAISYTE